MSVLDHNTAHPTAAGTLTFGAEGQADGFSLDSAGNLTLAGNLAVAGSLAVTGSAQVNGGFVRKTSDESISSDTNLQNDDQLVLSAAANATYIVDVFAIYEAASANDINFGWSAPAGATLDWTLSGVTDSGATAVARAGVGDTLTAGGNGAGVANQRVARITGTLVTAGTAGSLQLRWAQFVSGVTATKVIANSWMRLQRVA